MRNSILKKTSFHFENAWTEGNHDKVTYHWIFSVFRVFKPQNEHFIWICWKVVHQIKVQRVRFIFGNPWSGFANWFQILECDRELILMIFLEVRRRIGDFIFFLIWNEHFEAKIRHQHISSRWFQSAEIALSLKIGDEICLIINIF